MPPLPGGETGAFEIHQLLPSVTLREPSDQSQTMNRPPTCCDVIVSHIQLLLGSLGFDWLRVDWGRGRRGGL